MQWCSLYTWIGDLIKFFTCFINKKISSRVLQEACKASRFFHRWTFSGRNAIPIQNSVCSPVVHVRGQYSITLLSYVVSNLWKSKTCQAGNHFCACFATCNYQAEKDQAHFCLHLPFISHNCFGLLSIKFFCLSSYIIPLATCHAIIRIIPRSNSCSK